MKTFFLVLVASEVCPVSLLQLRSSWRGSVEFKFSTPPTSARVKFSIGDTWTEEAEMIKGQVGPVFIHDVTLPARPSIVGVNSDQPFLTLQLRHEEFDSAETCDVLMGLSASDGEGWSEAAVPQSCGSCLRPAAEHGVCAGVWDATVFKGLEAPGTEPCRAIARLDEECNGVLTRFTASHSDCRCLRKGKSCDRVQAAGFSEDWAWYPPDVCGAVHATCDLQEVTNGSSYCSFDGTIPMWLNVDGDGYLGIPCGDSSIGCCARFAREVRGCCGDGTISPDGGMAECVVSDGQFTHWDSSKLVGGPVEAATDTSEAECQFDSLLFSCPTPARSPVLAQT